MFSHYFLQTCPRKFPCTIRSMEKGSPALSGDRIDRHLSIRNQSQMVKRQTVERTKGSFYLSFSRCFVPKPNERRRRQVFFFLFYHSLQDALSNQDSWKWFSSEGKSPVFISLGLSSVEGLFLLATASR